MWAAAVSLSDPFNGVEWFHSLVMPSLAWFAGPEPSYRMRAGYCAAAIAVTHTSTLGVSVAEWQP